MITHLAILILGVGIGIEWKHRIDRRAVAEIVDRANLADYFRDAADRLALELDDVKAEAGHAITTLRVVVADQAVIVRRALGRPQKRHIPAGAT